ncbi:Hyaluronan synthase-related protein [Dirofilaria immitis]
MIRYCKKDRRFSWFCNLNQWKEHVIGREDYRSNPILFQPFIWRKRIVKRSGSVYANKICLRFMCRFVSSLLHSLLEDLHLLHHSNKTLKIWLEKNRN